MRSDEFELNLHAMICRSTACRGGRLVFSMCTVLSLLLRGVRGPKTYKMASHSRTLVAVEDTLDHPAVLKS